MKWSRFIWIPLGTGFLTVVLQVVDQKAAALIGPPGTKGLAWICFTTWALYFLAGATPKAGAKVLLSYGTGICGAIAIMKLAGFLGQYVGGFWAAPAAIMCVAPILLSLERFPPFDFIPGIFVSVAVFFALMLYVEGATFGNSALVLGVYATVGIFLGWLVVVLRGGYTRWVEKSGTPPREQATVTRARRDAGVDEEKRQAG